MSKLVVVVNNHRFEFDEEKDFWEGNPVAVCGLINRHFHANASSPGADPDRNRSALRWIQELLGKKEVEVLEVPEKKLPSTSEEKDLVY